MMDRNDIHDISVDAAREWVADSFGDSPESLTDLEVVAVVERTYVGGWAGFVADLTV